MKVNLDKFYTSSVYSKKCIDKVANNHPIQEFDLVVEPSAGDGSFYKQIPHTSKIGIDISPVEGDTSIQTMDFFDYTPGEDKKNILTIGNPPFGRVSSLAVKFFNHAAKWSSVIAFILPRTFRKLSVINRLDPHFHLEYDEELPQTPCQFTPKMMVKCCFQIWVKKDTKREKLKLPLTHTDWEFLKLDKKNERYQLIAPKKPDFAIRAYGGKIGEIERRDLHLLNRKSWHWIKANIDVETLIDRFKKIDYSNSLNTARQNSTGKAELVYLYNKVI